MAPQIQTSLEEAIDIPRIIRWLEGNFRQILEVRANLLAPVRSIEELMGRVSEREAIDLRRVAEIPQTRIIMVSYPSYYSFFHQKTPA